IDWLVSRASMIRLSLHPLPASETSAFNKIRAFSTRRAGLFPFRISVSSRSRSSARRYAALGLAGAYRMRSCAILRSACHVSGDRAELDYTTRHVHSHRRYVVAREEFLTH